MCDLNPKPISRPSAWLAPVRPAPKGCHRKYTQHLSIAKEVDNRTGEGWTYANLGCTYQSQGDFSKAIKYHTQDLAIAKEVDDRSGEGGAYANIGCTYQ